MNTFSLPDLVIDNTQIIASTGYLTVASDSFIVKIKMHNLGKATNDSVHLYLVRKFPGGNTDTAFYSNIAAVKNTDSILVKLPVVINRDKGTTTITAIIDDNNRIPE